MSKVPSSSKDGPTLDRVHAFIDANIREIRYCVYGVGVVGVLLVGRSIRLTTVFRRVEDIPESFVSKNVQLRGKVEGLSDTGALQVAHIPISRVPFTRHMSDDSRLHVILACVDVTPAGRKWLQDNVLHKSVWFRLLHRDLETPSLHCTVTLPKMFQSVKINEALVGQGLAKVLSYSKLELPRIPQEPAYLRTLDRLISLENRAAQKGKGLWFEPKPSLGSRSLTTVNKILLSPVRLVKWVWKKLK